MTLAHYFHRLLNMGLRGMTLVGKFVLLFFLAKYLAPQDVGLYGLLVVTIAYATYPLGLDFYAYSSREIIRIEPRGRGRVFKNQLALHGWLYVVALPLLLLIFYFDLLSWQMAPWFFVLVVLEHACQEMMRLLIALEKQLVASITLFVRQGLWPCVVIVLMALDPEYRQFSNVLMAWVAGAAAAVVMSAFALVKALGGVGFLSEAVDWRWIRRGLKVAIPMFIGTISLNFVTSVDRYWFESLQGREMLGGYVFFMSISAAMMSFLEAGVFFFMYPSIVAAHSAGNEDLFRSNLRKMLVQTVVLAVAFAVGVLLCIDWILLLLQRDVYSGMKSILYVFLLAMIFQALSYIPHYALYAQGRDRAIVGAHVLSVPVFILTVWLTTRWDAFYAVPVGGGVAYIFMLLYKYCAYRYPAARVEVLR